MSRTKPKLRTAQRIATGVWNSAVFMTWASIGIRTLGLLALLPLTLARFSSAEFALWMLVSLLVALQPLLDFGFAATFVRVLAYGSAERSKLAGGTDSHAARVAFDQATILPGMRWVYRRMGLVFFVLLAVAGSASVAQSIAALDSPRDGWLTWAIVTATAPIALTLSTYSAFLQGIDQIARLRRWEAMFAGVRLACAISVILAGGGLLALVVAWQLVTVVSALTIKAVAAPRIPEADPQHDARHVVAAIWPSVWRSGLGVAAVLGTQQGSGVLYAQLAGPEDVGGYLLALRLVGTLRDFSVAPLQTRLPTLARLYAEGSKQMLLQEARTGITQVHWLFTAGVVALGLLGDSILQLLGTDVLFPSPAAWWLLGVAMLLERIAGSHMQLYSAGNHILWHVSNGITGALMLAIMPLGYALLELPGIPLAIALANAMVAVPFAAVLTYRTYGRPIWRIDRVASAPPLILLLAILVAMIPWSVPG